MVEPSHRRRFSFNPPRRRTWIASGTVVLLGTVAAAATLDWWRPLPPPQECTSEQLVGWLVRKDVSQLPPQTQTQLLRRVEQELEQGVATGEMESQLSPFQLDQVRENVLTLVKLWMFDQSREHHALPPNRKREFVDDKLAQLQRWADQGLADIVVTDSAPSGTTPSAAMFAQFDNYIQQWSRSAVGDEGEQLQQFVAELRSSVVRQLLPNWFTGQKEAEPVSTSDQ